MKPVALLAARVSELDAKEVQTDVHVDTKTRQNVSEDVLQNQKVWVERREGGWGRIRGGGGGGEGRNGRGEKRKGEKVKCSTSPIIIIIRLL